MHIDSRRSALSTCKVKFKLFILCAAGAAVGNRRKMKEIRYNNFWAITAFFIKTQTHSRRKRFGVFCFFFFFAIWNLHITVWVVCVCVYVFALLYCILLPLISFYFFILQFTRGIVNLCLTFNSFSLVYIFSSIITKIAFVYLPHIFVLTVWCCVLFSQRTFFRYSISSLLLLYSVLCFSVDVYCLAVFFSISSIISKTKRERVNSPCPRAYTYIAVYTHARN